MINPDSRLVFISMSLDTRGEEEGEEGLLYCRAMEGRDNMGVIEHSIEPPSLS